jgi:hypothetical protein
VTVAVEWQKRRHLRRTDVRLVQRVGPLRPGGEYTNTRLDAMFDRAPLDFGPPDDDGPDGGGEPYPVAS